MIFYLSLNIIYFFLPLAMDLSFLFLFLSKNAFSQTLLNHLTDQTRLYNLYTIKSQIIIPSTKLVFSVWPVNDPWWPLVAHLMDHTSAISRAIFVKNCCIKTVGWFLFALGQFYFWNIFKLTIWLSLHLP